MNTYLKIIILTFSVFVLSACSSQDTVPTLLGFNEEVLDSSESRLVIYREPVQEVEKKSPYLYINNQSYGQFKDNYYSVVSVESGFYHLTVKEIDSITNLYGEDDWPVRPKTLAVSIAPGQEKFIRYTVRINDSVFDWYDAVFEEVPREKAMQDLDFMARQR
ncbi:DUF2846 domain-containing protein [Litoribrevibacter albus]|uniref:DUF2846 domain-containing protein n=1 Tax=Litoribrevibacter albus TaxID=1473156 RepID=UPI0024E08518|nr:DUF2846 domain-containing protein [Litoribrevibacter albus]